MVFILIIVGSHPPLRKVFYNRGISYCEQAGAKCNQNGKYVHKEAYSWIQAHDPDRLGKLFSLLFVVSTLFLFAFLLLDALLKNSLFFHAKFVYIILFIFVLFVVFAVFVLFLLFLLFPFGCSLHPNIFCIDFLVNLVGLLGLVGSVGLVGLLPTFFWSNKIQLWR